MLQRLRDKCFSWGERHLERHFWFLAPLSWIWGFVSFCKNKLYDLHFFSVHRVPCPVVSVGNLIAGGSGKTPFVHLLASQFSSRKIAILSRGYGAIADEALLLKRRLPNARVYVGKDRVLLARRAFQEGAELIVVDDGFQYRKLHRDLDLVLLSRADLFDYYLPRGSLRDSPKRLERADGILITEEDLQLVPEKVLDLQGKEVGSIAGYKVGLFCGIARPFRFKKTVAALGAEIVDAWMYADHAVAAPKALHAFAKKCKLLGGKALLCTEKDFVKLSPSFQTELPIYFLEISLTIKKDLPAWEKLVAKIDQTIDNFSYDG